MARKIICQCESCESFGIPQAETAFYASNFHLLNKKYPVCKKCVDANTDITKLSGILSILQQLDFPYFDKTWEEIAKMHPDAILGRYIAEIRKNATTRKMHFADTDSLPEECTGLVDLDVATQKMRDFFGSDFSSKELIAMNTKYDFLKTDYDEITSMHVEALANYCRLKVKEEFAISADQVDEAKKWSSMASSAATACGINPSQLKKADLIGGISTFAELTQIIEDHADGVIPVLPQFKTRPSDAIDFNIWCYIDYARHLEGKDLCSYEDVYHFYDKRKSDYIKLTGDKFNIFKHDVTEENRPQVIDFVKMPTDPSEAEIGELDGK